ncbi:MAG: hypothetical protein IJC46_05155 [Clostridia bacterium]|nr:hypothetical protein [Clostridia bacterium]
MKRLFLFIAAVAVLSGMLVYLGGCSETEPEVNEGFNATNEQETQEVKYEYYEGTSVPTLSTLLGEPMIVHEELDLYGPYSSQEEAAEVMKLYASTLMSMEFSLVDDSFGYELTNGQDTVTIVGNDYQGNITILVLVE